MIDSNESYNKETISHDMQVNKSHTVSFFIYLKTIYQDLTTRKEEIDDGKMSQIIFENFLDLPLIVTEKIYNSFNTSYNTHLEEAEFVNGLHILYAGSLEKRLKLVFDIFDVQREGLIMKEDVLLLLSYLHSVENEGDLTILSEINDNFWGEYNSLSFEQFCNLVESKNSDVFVLFLCFLFHFKPFHEESLKFFHQNTSHCQKSKFHPESKLKDRMNSPCEENLTVSYSNVFEKIAAPSRNLIFYLTHHLHFNLKLMQRKSSSTNITELDKKRKSENYMSEEKNGKILEDDLINDIKLWGSPGGTANNSQDNININFDEAFGVNWDVNENDHNCRNSCNLNLSNVKHNKAYPDHSFTNSCSTDHNNTLHNLTHLQDDQHLEVIVYKLSSFSKRRVKTYKLVSIGNDIFYFKLKKYSENTYEYKGFHHLSGCHVDTSSSEEFKFDGETYVPLKIFSNCGGKVIYDLLYFTSIDDLKTFVERVRVRLGIRSITDYYDMYEELGKGQFGKVRMARSKTTGDKVAVKIIKKTYMKSKEVQMIKWEVEIMRFLKNVNNPYVIRTLDIFESRSSIYLIMEYLQGGNLNSFLVDQGTILKERKAKELMLQICRGVKFLHQYGIIHRDLKPENIMLVAKASSPQIKIMDFGLSKVLTKYDKTGEGYGSLCYLAPEVLLKQNYGHKVDIWSLGVILYYLLSGYLPFDDSKDEIIVIAKKIVNIDLNSIFNSKTKFFSPQAKLLIARCLERNVEKRISSYQIVDSEWFWT